MGIQRNRGCLIRIHASGIRVVMYHDAPGQYYDGTGKPTTEAIAREAGFDIARFEKQRKKNQMRKNFENTLEIQFDEAQERLDKLTEDDPDAADGLRIEKYGKGSKCIIVDAHGNSVTNQPASREECVLVYRGLTGKDYEEPKKQQGGKSETDEEKAAKAAKAEAAKAAKAAKAEKEKAKAAKAEGDKTAPDPKDPGEGNESLID